MYRSTDSISDIGSGGLFKTKLTDAEARSKIEDQYGSDRAKVAEVFSAYKKRLAFITDRANKFKDIVIRKHGVDDFEVVVEKAKSKAKKYDIADDEFELFLNLALTQTKHKDLYSIPSSKLSATLGYDPRFSSSEKLMVRDDELDVLRDILKLTEETRAIHNQVVLQHLAFNPFSPEMTSGTFDKKKQNLYSHVHPVLAAMFFHKIDLFERQMLIGSIGNLVKTKNEGKPITNQPEWDLYWNLISDPNEAVCDMSSPLKDLHNRFVLQTQIWDHVHNMRQGLFYRPNLVEFLSAVDACKTNIYEAPDMYQIKDEGTIMRRILSAFSLRPTLVSTQSIYTQSTPVSYRSHTSMMGPSGVHSVTRISMINMRIPESYHGFEVRHDSMSLEDGLRQPQWMIENKMLVPKTHTVMHSNDVIIFNVNRRNQTVDPRVIGKPNITMVTLPLTVVGSEQINRTSVTAPDVIQVGSDVFSIASVVYVDTIPIPNPTDCLTTKPEREVIVGCSAMMFDSEHGNVAVYAPLKATTKNIPVPAPGAGTPPHNITNPVAKLEDDALKTKYKEQQGTIYIYKKVSDAAHPCLSFMRDAA